MKLKLHLTALLLSIGLLSGNARAMTIHDFGRLNVDDASTYVTLLVEGSAKMLRANGQPEQAKKAVALFKDASKNGGVTQFATNLKAAYATNHSNAINPNNRQPDLTVEDAMALTLKDNGIIVTVAFLHSLQKEFKPSGLPQIPPAQSSEPGANGASPIAR